VGDYGSHGVMRPDAAAADAAYGGGMSAFQTLASALSHATVDDVMSRGVITCPPETRLAAVAATMASHEFHAAVILAREGGRALVITDLDLIRAALSFDLDRSAADIAREPIVTISPSAPLEDAVALMAKQDLGHLLVAEPEGAWPEGVLSSFDVAAVASGRDPALTRALRPGPARPLVSATTLSATTVAAVMHPNIAARTPQTPLSELAGTMADLHMHCIAVAGMGHRDDGDEHLVWGLVSDMDVVHAAHRRHLALPASDFAAARPLALPETARLDRAAALMTEHEATHIVVVGRTGLPLGVVSTLDVLRVVAAG
jgi:CBS domain-containing protein